MRALTFNEGAVLEVVRRLDKRLGWGEVQVSSIKSAALDNHHVRYDSVDRALKGLVDVGLVEKVRRGYYRPADVPALAEDGR